MSALLLDWLNATWLMLVDSALLLIIGLLLAGLIRLVLTEARMQRLLAGNPRTAVFKAALFGVPLPLCSCSVLPVALQLRKSGLGKGGTTSFLIATPESGVDSILLTYSLTDPLLTVARPVAAFATASVAGLIEASTDDMTPAKDLAEPVTDSCCDDSCGCGSEKPAVTEHQTIPRRILGGIHYAFTDLIADLAPYLFVGYLLAGLIGMLLNQDIISISETLRSGWGGYTAAMLLGLPLYICATSSTPLAASLLAGGFSPGAILVFLLVGPATNIATLTVVSRILGGWSTLRYVISIAVVAVICGLITDQLYELWDVDAVYRAGSHLSSGWLYSAAAALLSGFIVYHVAVKWGKKLRRVFA